MITHGLRLRDLGTPRLNWRDLWVIVRQSPARSAIARALGSEGWTVTDYMLANLIDVGQVGNWQRQGRRNAPRPAAIRRPGAADDANTQHYGSDPIPVSQFMDWWNAQDDLEEGQHG